MKPDSSAKKSPRKILLVDDHPLTRRGMAQLISQEEDLVVCGEAGDANRALSLVGALKPHLMLIDVTLPGKPGLELIKEMRARYPEILLLVVSMHDEGLYAERALHAGARGYLMKNEGGDKLLEAIRQVLSGKVYLSESLSDQILDLFSTGRPRRNRTPMGSLTDREFEVFQFIGQGLTTREMSAQLHMSSKTVETHRLHIRAKLGLKSGPELIKYAVRWASTRDLI